MEIKLRMCAFHIKSRKNLTPRLLSPIREHRLEQAPTAWAVCACVSRKPEALPGPALSIDPIGDRQLGSGHRSCSSRDASPLAAGKGRANWRARKKETRPHAAFPEGCACSLLPPLSSEWSRERLPAAWPWRFTFPRLRALPRCSRRERK